MTPLSNPERNAEMHKTLLAAAIALAVFAGSLAAAPATYKEPLDARTVDTIKSEFSKLMELANRHDFKALHEMFWQSPSTLLVAKNAMPLRGQLGRLLGQRGYRSEATRQRNAQAIPDDYKLDKSREELEGRLRDHPASASGTRRQGVGSTRCLRCAHQVQSNGLR
jgi:hypothetical protein